VELEPLEFIARLVQHIPDVRERQVVYYGVYANASKRLPRRRERGGQGAGEMRILAFITDPPVVDKILRHVGWHPGEPAPDLIRAPPGRPSAMLKVAESPPKT